MITIKNLMIKWKLVNFLMKFEFHSGDGPRTWGPDINNKQDVQSMIKLKNPSFIKCLHIDDQFTFLKWYTDLIFILPVFQRQKIIDSGGIIISVFLKGMYYLLKKGLLKHSYFFYRQAFWGEHRSGKKFAI